MLPQSKRSQVQGKVRLVLVLDLGWKLDPLEDGRVEPDPDPSVWSQLGDVAGRQPILLRRLAGLQILEENKLFQNRGPEIQT